MDIKKHCPSQGFGWDNFSFKNHGFTLLELLVTLAIASVLAAISFPSLSAMLSQNRMVVTTNQLAGALAYARSEAVMRGENVVTCHSINQTKCHRSQYWNGSYIIFVDSNRNRLREPEEQLLRVYVDSNNDTQIELSASGRAIEYYMRYLPTGEAYPNGTFRICSSSSNSRNALIMTQSGRLRLSKTMRDGYPITCN
ncbi:MAG: GspH/FimT family pseudopilin [Woeseiaceae bacterium]